MRENIFSPMKKSTTEENTSVQRAKGNWICPWVQTLQQEIFMYLLLWYNASLVTLWVNKYLLTDLGVNSNALSTMQVTMCLLCGKLYDIYRGVDSYAIPHAHSDHGSSSASEQQSSATERCDDAPTVKSRRSPSLTVQQHMTVKSRIKSLMHSKAMKDMTGLGVMRLINVYLGLTALKFVAVSFTETVKSTAPFFTVVLSYIVLGTRTPFIVCMSLIPVVLGLILCSVSDSSYNLIGFASAILANCSDCMQNVMTKRLLNQYSVSTIQMYTCIVAFIFQFPFLLSTALTTGIVEAKNVSSSHLTTYLVIDCLAFYSQSMLTYGLMSIVSPLSHSVANTAKRALLIVLSVRHFGNPVSLTNWIGVALVTGGVFLYNHANKIVQKRQETKDNLLV